ncbi:ABC transporter substrate-binding protein [Streptomyces sp. Li-HN-5-11]|uniref:ABC transporter substrate-binding protein n=1 Tax=Streptomyces sp. Li-HN-5-11 TaxID=3075432 RepID=UPI0028A931BD|nr:ABC transporter substrate-binding protein [Streptomyces sp. Li-HN-5-11]WNM31932.1 ABC transporter substrate-binding protein [Streptomyces sp. Li-HN-5-11]
MHIRNPHTGTRSRAVVALAAAVLLTMTACDGQSASQSSSSTSTLSMAIMGTPNSFAPAQLDQGQQQYVWSTLYDTLLLLDNRGQLRPGAAESWQYSRDARTLTLKLRKGMTFSTGAPLTSSAVKATLDLIRTSGANQAQLAAVSSVDAPDDHTVVLRLSRPDGALLTALAGAGGVIADPKTMNTRSAALNPVSSGPYTLDKSTVNGSVYVLKRREDYWNKKAYPFPTVRIRVISDRAAALNALKAGEINAGSVEVQQLSTLGTTGFEVKRIDATSLAGLVLSDREGKVLKPLGDVRVRQAINMAFDREKMVKLFLRGSGKATEQMFNPKDAAYDPPLDTTYPYDPAAAKRLMAQAGYPNGFSVSMPSLVFTKPFEPTITQSLADIGIKVTWDPVPAQQILAAMTSKKYPMLFVVDALRPTPAQTRDFYAPNGYRNVFGSTDPRLTKLLLQANDEPDPAKAAGVYKEINAFGVRNAWNAPVFDVGISWVTKKGITYLGDGSSTQNTIRQFGVDGQSQG